ncbi:MAG TPA: ABATE domain-containing protein, partial [Ktedonobacteraceae bacterium]|nr:ABATE domain-containing protein [Ktedonobacteraceae bacterium]
ENSQAHTSIMNYPFLSGVLALDLVNTEVIVRGRRYDLLCSPEDVARWWQEALAHHPDREKVKEETQATAWSLPLLEKIKQVRAAIRTLCSNLVQQQPLDQEALAVLNAILAMGCPALDVAAEGEMVPVYRAREADQGAILMTIALSAFHLFTQAEKHRLHKCKNDRCILFFYDNTKSATRQWCSLECMNRARSLQHYQHVKEERLRQTGKVLRPKAVL